MLSRLKRLWNRPRPSPRPVVPIYLCCHHKTGTVLMRKVFMEICDAFGWTYQRFLGHCDRVPADVDVALLNHSLIDLSAVSTPFTGIHIVRDPRDVVVSGYLYHQRTTEAWCTNTNVNVEPPLGYPHVPHILAHQSEAVKQAYVASLEGRSYQQTLQSLPTEAGLRFEMDHYGRWTIEQMLAWDYDRPEIKEMQFERFMADFDDAFRALFTHLEFPPRQAARALEIARRHDLGRMAAAQLELDAHIASRQTSRWKAHLTPELCEAFISRFGDVAERLGYEPFRLDPKALRACA